MPEERKNNSGAEVVKVQSAASSNPMRGIFLEKLTLNTGIGNTEDKYEGAKEILSRVTGKTPTAATAKARKPEFGIQKHQIIGAFVTLRGKEAEAMLKRALDAVDNKLKKSAIAGNSLSFGIEEYIYLNGMKYDPKIGMLGMNVNATFARKGMRVERRRRAKGKVAKSHKRIAPEDLAAYVSKAYGAKFEEEEA
ncbi:MAG: 50S ribosomal protein L5 [Candidatus Micrarchaeia archaeon]